MLHSETIGKISAALAKAQGTMTTAGKDAKGNYGKYADLASIWETCREPLATNEIAVIQSPGETGDRVVTMTTILSHSSGEWFSDTLTIPMSKVDAQGYGSAVTYARRYALAAMVGIAPAEDDGTAAAAIGGDNSAPRKAAAPKPPTAPAKGWDEWKRDIQADLDSAKDEAEIDKIKARELEFLKVARSEKPEIYEEIGKSIAAARADVGVNPILEKKAA